MVIDRTDQKNKKKEQTSLNETIVFFDEAKIWSWRFTWQEEF